MLEVLASDQFAIEVDKLSGYELERPGEVLAELG